MSAASVTGYSGKPTWQKLGLTPGMRVLVHNAPGDYAELVGAQGLDLHFVAPRAAFAFAHVFASSAAVLRKEVEALAKTLPANGLLWISWPKKSAKVASDIVEGTIRDIALPLGLVDVKVCAVDAIWSGLKLVWRLERRADKR